MPNSNLAKPDVRAGQVWADNDPRMEGRTFRVDAVADRGAAGLFAICTVLTLAKHTYSGVGRTHRIAVRRFRPTSTGYRLVQEAPDA